MRSFLIACAAALLLAQPAGAVSEAKNPRDAQGEPILPADPGDRPALERTPDRQAEPDREAREEEIRRDLAHWRERIENWRRDYEASGGEDEAALLVDALETAEQSWRRLAQSTGPGWERSLNQVQQARERLAEAWRKANP